MPKHPLERWFDVSLAPVFRVSLVLSLLLMIGIGLAGADLRVPSAPLGILSFELAGAAGVAALLAGWSDTQCRDAMLLQGLDYAFLVAYSSALASAALLLGRRHAPTRPRLSALGRPMAWALTFAGLADAVENTPMTLMLHTGVPDPTGATISLVFASTKFVLLGLGIAYVLTALAVPRGKAPA